MDGKIIEFRYPGQPWKRGKRGFPWLLAASLFLAFQHSCVFSFTCRSHHGTPLVRKHGPDRIGWACAVGERSRPRATKADDQHVDDAPSGRAATAAASPTTHLVFPGGGIYFYHQAGVIAFLRERYDLSACTFAGASAGALTATLAAAGVDFEEATRAALALARRAGVWDRSGGLQGIWGPLIAEWLDALLPAAIAPLRERITLLVTPVPSFGKTKISRFENRADLIQCNMASIHLPWFLDGQLTATFRGRPHIDGSFLSQESDYSPNNGGGDAARIDTIVLDWSQDPAMSAKGGLDIVEALSPEGIYGLLEQGKRYGQVMEDRGTFDKLPRLS